MAKIACFYNCEARGLTLKNIEKHYQKYHTPLKSYYSQEFTCDNCRNYYNSSLLYSPARNREELASKAHYCPKCIKQFQNQSIQSNLKPKPMKKTQKSKLKPKKSLKKKLSKQAKKTVKTKPITALTLKKSQTSTPAYYNCLLNQAKRGFQGKITKACQECRTNAPALNLAFKKEAQKLVKTYQQLGISLSKILSH